MKKVNRVKQPILFREQTETDVLIMGAGLAGISAAIAAAEGGARVTLVSSSVIFSGSSFYPGTWGLGLVAPENDGDVENLAQAITQLGENMTSPELVEVFSANIQQSVNKLEAMGCQLKRPKDSAQREYIPCFDNKNRNWYGILQQQSVGVLADRMMALGVVLLPHTEIIDLIQQEGRVCGALALRVDGSLLCICCGALVLAGGGMGGLFRHRLNTSDVTGVGQFLALRAGASLVNVEFFQIFLGFIDPAPKTIYNEKMFRYTNFCHTGTNRSIFEELPPDAREQLLGQRSTHGPFTSRLADRAVDRILSEVLQRDDRGVEISYDRRIREMENPPEFIAGYFEWLWEKKQLSLDDKVRLGLFAHASNGGIVIDTHGYTGVPGLFACGEATGGMHGADRIGGLSTANCLVFGNRAGAAAARASRDSVRVRPLHQGTVSLVPHANQHLQELQGMNSATLMVTRDGPRLEAARLRLSEMSAQVRQERQEARTPSPNDAQQLRDSLHLCAALTLTDCVQQAALLRCESRGSHYRTDYPDKDDRMAHCIRCHGKELPTVAFEE